MLTPESDSSNSSQSTADKTDQVSTNLKSGFKGFIQAVGDFLKDRLSILDNAQPEKTIEGISQDIDFKGFNLWILIVAILIASVGLNANSTAVVVGAMLISPLMGPIMGLGLSIGINDFVMLKRSLRNLGIAVAVSIVTSALFFFLIPLDDASSELLARTKPDIRDVFIAFFGGFAGILAGSRREKNNVIPGVAIATALMPPLCTAGYGLGTLQFSYFIGATYLFLINAFFIALAAVLVTRYLKFPIKTFIDKQTETKAKRWLIITVIIMIIPASVIFIGVVKDTIFLRKVNLFIAENISYEDAAIVKTEIIPTDTISYVDLVIFGETIPEKTIQNWQRILNTTVENTKLRIFQGSEKKGLPEVEKLVDMFTSSQSEILSKEDKIRFLEERIVNLEKEELPKSLLEEIKINYPELELIKMGRMIYADLKENQTGDKPKPSVYVWWSATVADSVIELKNNQLKKWLEVRLDEDTVDVSSLRLHIIEDNSKKPKK